MQLIQKLLAIRVKRIQLFAVIAFAIWYFKQNIWDRPTKTRKHTLPKHIPFPNYNVHIFYEGGFRNMKFDEEFITWRNVDTESDRLMSAYYPSLGLYSSNDPQVIRTHMSQIASSGIGVVVVTRWPSHYKTAPPMYLIMKEAHAYDLKVTIQIPNYRYRGIYDVKKQIVDFFDNYGNHPALYKTYCSKRNKSLPIIYIYKTYLIKFEYWRGLLQAKSNISVRNTAYDALYIATVESKMELDIAWQLGFDGFYTFIGSTYFTFTSNWYNWPHMQDMAVNHSIIFIPTISPGYDDRSNSNIHPFEHRDNGIYYIRAWGNVLRSGASFVAINSFNGWVYGNQIEPAATVANKGFLDYEPHGPNKYLSLTLHWVIEFANRSYYGNVHVNTANEEISL